MTPTPSLLLRLLTRFFVGALVVFCLGGLSYARSGPQASQRPPQTVTPQSYPAEQVKAGAPLFARGCGGFLLPPVTGPVTSPFGYRIHPIYHYWGLHDGTDFGVSCGEGMRAAADGTVLSRYWSDVYGNRLYIDVGKVNGHNLTVVYNHATSYRVNVGDHVTRGEIVGYVGSTGWSTGCHLHFTVLQDGTAVDPMNYL